MREVFRRPFGIHKLRPRGGLSCKLAWSPGSRECARRKTPISDMRGFLKSGRVVDLFPLTTLLLVTRIAFRSRYLYDIDSVNFALGLRRFDPAAHQPHPPGYFLYICLGRLVNAFFHDANAALVTVSIAASCGALFAIYLLAEIWFGRQAARFAGLIFVFSPLVWFHGTVALTYAVEVFFSALAGYLCWRIHHGSRSLIVPAAVTLGLAAGFRPSILLFLGPLLLYSLVFAPGRVTRGRTIAGAAALILTIAAWCLPMLSASGGFDAYRAALLSLWRISPARQTVFNSSPVTSLSRFLTIVGIYALCFGGATLLTFRRSRPEHRIEYRTKIFIRIWVLPGLLFFIFIFLRFVNSGYLLVISPPVFAWLGLKASQWYAVLRPGGWMRAASIAMFAAGNSLIFLFAPVYCSWGSVRHFESELESVLRSIPVIASPGDTMIVGFDSHFLGYRHAGYYLPEWFTAQYPAVRLTSGTRVFVMKEGDTMLVSKLPADGFKRFLFFPLPSDDMEYRDYLNRIRARFRPTALRTIIDGGREFVTGPIAELSVLFPDAIHKN